MKKRTPSLVASTRQKNLWAILALLVILQAGTLLYMVHLRGAVVEDAKLATSALINTSEEKRYKMPIIDIAENRVYIPEARIFLPLTDISRDVRYDFREYTGNATLYFSLPVAIGQQVDGDDPRCDKMASLAQNKESGDVGKFVGEISPTKHGMKYISRHAGCKIYSDSTSTALADILKQAQSY